MILKKLSYSGFLTYGPDTYVVDFDKAPDMVQITGRNGVGKSTIAVALKYGLYGVVPGFHSKELPNDILGTGWVEVQFLSMANDDVVVRRGLNPNTLSLKVNSVDISDNYADKAELKHVIQEYVGIPVNIFSYLVCLEGSDKKSFLSMTPAELRSVRDVLFGADIYNNMNALLKVAIKDLNVLIRDLETSKSSIEDSIKEATTTLDKVKQASDSDVELKKLEQNIKEKQNDLDKLIDQLDKDDKEYSKLHGELRGMEAQLEVFAHHASMKAYLKKAPELIKAWIGAINSLKEVSNKYDVANKSYHDAKDTLTILKSEISNLKSVVEMYDGDTCNYCMSPLDTDEAQNRKEEYKLSYRKALDNHDGLKPKMDKLKKESNEYFSMMGDARRATNTAQSLLLELVNSMYIMRSKRGMGYLAQMSTVFKSLKSGIESQNVQVVVPSYNELLAHAKENFDGGEAKDTNDLSAMVKQKGDALDKGRKSEAAIRGVIDGMKSSMDSLRRKISSSSGEEKVIELIDNLEINRAEKEAKLATKLHDQEFMNKLSGLLNNGKIRARLVQSYISPINKKLQEIIDELFGGLSFSITMNDELKPVIYRRGNEVRSTSLSTGQKNKADLAITLAFNMTVVERFKINFTFYDEMFSSIYVDDIPVIIEGLKKMNTDKIKTFYVLHGSFNNDHVLNIIKSTYSTYGTDQDYAYAVKNA